jgi:hypothetical protein
LLSLLLFALAAAVAQNVPVPYISQPPSFPDFNSATRRIGLPTTGKLLESGRTDAKNANEESEPFLP